ncbi:MAG: rRNA methyltransferase [Crocinitomicaceae bacterium]|nr:rRNA methyltransferase [Crocinitomicaceae bacterium]|tara:strand:+ start:98 stop:760 length:663 start_codon:yes stop_codon:yes gene_type:complete
MPNLKFQALLPYISKERLTRFDDALQQRTRRLCMVLENVYQSRNASAVMRSCDGMGIQDVHLIEDINPWVFNRGVSKGTPSWLTLHRYTNTQNPTASCIQALRSSGYKIAVTSPHVNGYEAQTLPIDHPVAVVMGTEFKGASERMLEAADYHVFIPMRGMAESLNISVAAGMIMHRIMENIHKLPLEEWQLTAGEKEALLLDWALKSVKKSDAILKHLEL